MRTHYGPWQPCWISNQHQKHKSGRGSSSEHFCQVWLKSVQRFQRRRFKCEKLTDGRRTHDKSSHGLWSGELKSGKTYIWQDKQDISWETDDKLVATVAEPTMSDKRSHFVFDSEELEDISKKLSKDYRYVYFC